MTRRVRAIGAVVALAAAAACTEPPDEGIARVSGHVEATEIEVASEVGGRVLELAVSEGDRVAAGAVVARLDTRDAALQMQRVRAERAAAEAQLRLLRAGSREQDIRHAEAQVQAAQGDATAIEAERRAAQLDLDRFEALLAANAGSRKQRDDARARVDVAQERLHAARERVAAAQETVGRFRAGARAEELQAARARVQIVDAQIATLEKAIEDAVVTAPAAGVVTQTLVEAGEIVTPRLPLLVITDLDNAWANLFVPEPIVPRLRLGQPATVHTDAGGPGVTGRLTFVSPRAEFTPRNVQTAEERSKLVYRVKVSVDNTSGLLKPGMPVDAEIPLE